MVWVGKELKEQEWFGVRNREWFGMEISWDWDVRNTLLRRAGFGVFGNKGAPQPRTGMLETLWSGERSWIWRFLGTGQLLKPRF